jgi:hypothetical protein
VQIQHGSEFAEIMTHRKARTKKSMQNMPWMDSQEENATYEATHGGDRLLGKIELGGGVIVLDGAIGLAGSIA